MLRFRWITFDRFKVVNLSRFYRVNFIRPYWVNFTVFSSISVKDCMKTVITSEYEALFRQHFRLATLYAERIVGSAHEAEDIVQEVFIALLDVDFSQIRQKESYLYRCVRNAALDHLHARMKNRFYDINSKETVRLAAEENAPGDEQAMIEQIAAIYHRIEALPEQGRRIFKMICIEHKSYVETARLLSLSLHTVKTHMSRSFKALRKMSMFFLTLF